MVPCVSDGLLIAAGGGTLTAVNSKILAANRMVTVIFLSNFSTFYCASFCHNGWTGGGANGRAIKSVYVASCKPKNKSTITVALLYTICGLNGLIYGGDD